MCRCWHTASEELGDLRSLVGGHTGKMVDTWKMVDTLGRWWTHREDGRHTGKMVDTRGRWWTHGEDVGHTGKMLDTRGRWWTHWEDGGHTGKMVDTQGRIHKGIRGT